MPIARYKFNLISFVSWETNYLFSLPYLHQALASPTGAAGMCREVRHKDLNKIFCHLMNILAYFICFFIDFFFCHCCAIKILLSKICLISVYSLL